MKKLALLLAVISLLGLLASCGTSKEDLITSIDDLNGKNIGVQRGSIGERYAENELTDAEIYPYSQISAAADALLNGELDAIVTDRDLARELITANEALIVLLDASPESTNYVYACREDELDLLGLIDVVLTESKSDGTFKDLNKAFFSQAQSARAAYITGPQVGANGTITIGVCPDASPFAYQSSSGDLVGFDLEFLKHVAAKVGKSLEVKTYSRKDLPSALLSGAIDVAAGGLTESDITRKGILCTGAYLSVQQVIVVLDD